MGNEVEKTDGRGLVSGKWIRTNRESTMLPSAYATIVPVENETYVITGGGYGHGIGMSQNGADAMAAMGKSWEEILNFFFKDIEITNVT